MEYMIFYDLMFKENLLGFDNESFYNKALDLKNNIKPISEWRCDTYNTLGTYDLSKDVLFDKLLDTIKNKVIDFAKFYGVENKTLKYTSAWINVSEPGDYQEYHMHPSNHFSAVYYIKAPENCGNLVIRSHESDKDMFPLPTNTLQPSNFKTTSIVPEEGELIIFRSNMVHMVEKNKSNQHRVSIAMNLSFLDDNG